MSNALTITQDAEDPRVFTVTGRRVDGRAEASVSLQRNRNRFADSDPAEVVMVNVSFRRQGYGLTVNGIELTGNHSVQINDPFGRRMSYWANSYVSRVDGGTVTDTARSIVREFGELVAAEFGTPENVHAARIEQAQKIADDAAENLATAADELREATAALAALRG